VLLVYAGSDRAGSWQIGSWPYVLNAYSRINTIIRKHPLCLSTPFAPFIAYTITQYSVSPRPSFITIQAIQYWQWQYRVKAGASRQAPYITNNSLDTGGGRVLSLDASFGLLATASASALALFLGSALSCCGVSCMT